MKNSLLSFITILMCASFAYAETHIITIKGLSDGNKVFDNSVNPVYSFFSEDNLFRFDCDPNLGASKPNYNKAGDLRLNAKNTFTINYNGSDQISKISFVLSEQGLKRLAEITTNQGEIKTQAQGDETVDWTGEAQAVTFTVGQLGVYGNEFRSDGTPYNGQFCFTQIIITTGIDEEPEQPVTPEPNYMIPGGTMHSAGNNYVEQLYSEGATVNIDQSWDSTPSALHQIVEGAVEVAPEATFTLNLKAKKLGPQSSTTVYEDLRFARARIYTDWDADGVFTEDQVIGTESPQAPYNVIGNMDVLDITKQFTVPAEAENTNSRIRVIYHNAWSNKDCTANSTDLVDGMAYDVKVKVGQRSGIDSITGDATDAPAEFYNLQGIRMDGNSLTPGIYIMRQGSKATKVLVR